MFVTLVCTFCFLLCVFCVFIFFCLSSGIELFIQYLFLQFYRPVPPGGSPIAVNKYNIVYHIISYNIISYHIISYRIISYRIILYRIIYHIISYHIISYHISYYIIYHIISYHISMLQCALRSRQDLVKIKIVPARDIKEQGNGGTVTLILNFGTG